ncbi:ead/Ea22-like family protein [Salmonella enterica]|nr:ead/Ea22-like family protein [Salmonella enterica]EJF5920042.1 ead/Ea22-like family protein [Salmonella enterica]EJF5942692.1 ead/Ea22-like family protein [Salmonella enterica]EKT1295776.1 ead/Ea22-like family protein [Salmonella enterica]EKT1304802.1 ead/Ea22-like family protein [Salmonella enterica]
MSKIDYQALRDAAERAIPAMERLLMLPVDDDLISEQELKDYGVDIDALNAFKFLTGPETVLALLDERERNQQYIKRRDQENEDIALTVGKLRVELEHYKSREERVTKLVLDNSTSWDVLYEKLEAAEKRLAEQSAIVAAAEKLVRCKGRYHSELNYRALAKLFGVVTPDLPPLEHENVHYADAAEVEITALRQRIAELEAREVMLLDRKSEIFWPGDAAEFDILGYVIAVKSAIRAAGIKVKG